MANTLDYIDWRGDLSFEAAPVNEIDKYIFACIGKPDYTGIIPADNNPVSIKYAVDGYFASHGDDDKLGLIASAKTLPMLKKAAVSRRYEGVRISGFINKIVVEKTEQFSALTVQADGINYISFRGTDDTLVGWKENCELAVLDSVPAQRDALAYLEWAADTYKGPLVVCGHSKGGNLAIYAASLASPEVQDRIIAVYSYDGPGFRSEFLEDIGYKRIADKVTTVVPYKSIVGMLLTQAGRLDVIQTETAGVTGHDGFTWDVCRDGFIHAPELSDMSKVFRTSIAETLSTMDTEDRRELVEEIFDVLGSTGAFTLSEFSDQNLRQAFELAKNFRKAGELREFMMKLVEKSLRQARLERENEEKTSEEDKDDKRRISFKGR